MPSLSQFIATRRAGWAKLEALLVRSEGNGLRSLDAEELDALAAAYRQLMSDLALARRDFPNDQLTASLNALAARAHLRIYRAPSGSWRRLGAFFWQDFARRFRAARWYVLAAAGLLLVPAVWAYWAAATDAAIRDALVPARLREVMQQGKTWTDFAAEVRPALATIIFTNNIRVSFLAFAGGALFGLGTVFVLVANGIQLGAILGAAHHYGVAAPLLAFVSPHGYLELTSIAIAAAGGLMLGYAELRPGLQRRRDALTRAARRAVELVLGAAPVLVIAGLIEGLVSPSRLPAEAKFALGPAAWLLLLAGLLTIARPPRTRVE